MKRTTVLAEAVSSLRTCPRCSFQRSQRRELSSTSSQRAVMGQMQMPKNIMSSVPKDATRSQQMIMKGMSGGKIPTDIGLLPTTFIAPGFREMYRMYSNDKRRLLTVLWLRIRRILRSPAALFYMLKWNKRKDRMTGLTAKAPSLELSGRLDEAQKLHHNLNTAIAAKDMQSIKAIACAGLLESLKQRLDAHKQRLLPNETWSLASYDGVRPSRLRRIPWPIHNLIPNRAIKVIDDLVAPLPMGGKQAICRQAIVRIRSTQTFERHDGKGSQKRRLTEYVVIQKMYVDGTPEKWRIWGTVQPHKKKDIEDLLETEKATAGESWLERFRNMMPLGGGGGATTGM